jgi:hypothetical protein
MRNVALLFLFFFLFLFVFEKKSNPGIGLDPSWKTALHEAHKYNYQFGKDIIFTFGPLGFIYTKEFHPTTKNLSFATGLILALGFFFSFFLYFKSKIWIKTLAFLISLIYIYGVSFKLDSLIFIYLAVLGIYILENLTFIKSTYVAFLSIPLGILVLIKGTFLIGVVFLIFIVTFGFLTIRSFKNAIILSLVPIFSLIFFWVLAGQSIINIPDYFMNILPIISGYSEAMNLVNGSIYEPIFYLLTSIILLYPLLKKIKANYLALLLLSGILFLAFKAGFSRHDGHAVVAANSLLLLSFIIPNKSQLQNILGISIALIFWVFSLSNYKKFSPIKSINNLESIVKSSINAFVYSDSLLIKYELKKEFIRKSSMLPTLNGTVDLYAFDLSGLFASENKWKPRPIFQSYCAYLPELAEKNANHLLSENAPDYIFFNPQTIDERFPSLDDGASWPIILHNFEPFDWVAPYLILKKNNRNFNTHPELILLDELTRPFYEKIKVPKGKVFAKINIEPSRIGKLVQLLWKPSEIVIKTTLKNGESKSWKYISSMGKSGFLISPLISNSIDFSLLFSEENYAAEIQSVEIITHPARQFLWKNQIKIQFYEINNPLHQNITELVKLTKPQKINIADYSIEHSSTCSGFLDVINDYHFTPLIKGDGWMVESGNEGLLADSIFLWIETIENEHYLIPTERNSREDIGIHFNNPKMIDSGFSFHSAMINPDQRKEVKIIFLKNKTIYTCDPFFLTL